jgi:hypothetical protein
MNSQRAWASLPIPIPYKSTGEESRCTFTILKTFLSRSIRIYLVARDDSLPTLHAMPNVVIGCTEILDNTIRSLFYSKSKTPGVIPI